MLLGCDSEAQPAPRNGSPQVPLVSPSAQRTGEVPFTLQTNELMREAIRNMSNAKSFHFRTNRHEPIFEIFPTEGDYTSPDKSRGTYKDEQGVTVEWVRQGQLYAYRPLNTGRWQANSDLPSASAAFLDFRRLEEILPFIERISTEGEELTDEVQTVHLSAIFRTEALDVAQLSPTGRFDIWVGRETMLIYQFGMSVYNPGPPEIFTFYSRINEPVSPPIVFPQIPLR
jgi:hypothetical protein